MLAAFLLCFGIGARAGNIVTIGTASGAPDEEVVVSVSLTNTDAVSTLQVAIPLNEQLTFVGGSALLSSRCSNHNVTAGVKDGTLNIMVYSIGFTAIGGQEGEVVSFRLKLGNLPTTIALTPSKVILADTDGNNLEDATTESGSVSIRCAKAQYNTTAIDFGSVPIRSTYTRNLTVTNIGNEPLEVTDLQFSKYPTDFSSTTTFPFTVSAGSSASINITYAPQQRGTVSETVKVLCNSISKLNNIALKAQPFAVNELHLQPASGIADEMVTVSMTMNNMDAISGFQFEFTLPSQLEYVPNSFTLSDRKQDHTIVTSTTNGVLRILCYSPADKPFNGEDGELATMQLKLTGRNSTTLKASKCVLTATIDDQVTNVCSADYGATITIRSPRINASNTLNMGATPITADAESNYVIRNDGNAPLTISRVEFNKDDFYIRQTLPLTIAANSSTTLNVVNPSSTEGNFDAVMQIYSNDPELRLWNVAVTGNRFAPNYFQISMDNEDVSAFNNLSIDIFVNTYDPIVGLQFDLTYPGRAYEPFENNYTLEERAAGMTVTWRQIDSNTLRFFCYFLSGSGIAAGEGKVMNLQLAPKGGEAPGGHYTVGVQNIKLGTAEMMDKYTGANSEIAFTIIYPVESISISSTTLTLAGGESATLRAGVNANATNQNIVWSSADGDIASVNANGKVTGKHRGATTITVASEENPTITATCTVEVTSDVTSNVRLPNVPFEFFYDAFEYDETSHSIPNHPLANLSAYSLQLTENIPEKIDDVMLRINNRCKGYIDKWAYESTESGSYFYRSGQECMTIVCKVNPNYGSGGNASDFISNRGWGYNYMFRIGDHGRMFLHTGTAYSEATSLAVQANEPQILAVRVDGVNNTIKLQNLTTDESLTVNGVNWGGSDNVFKLFYNDDGEYFLGDFYWMYYSFELLTDEQLNVFTSTVAMGDVNGDGLINLTDADWIVKHFVGKTPNGFISNAADVNGDGLINLSDASQVVNIFVGRN